MADNATAPETERFKQLRLESYEWVGVNMESMRKGMLEAQADRPGPARAGDKIIGLVDVRQQRGVSCLTETYVEMANPVKWVTYDTADEQLVQALFSVFHDEWLYPVDYATQHAIETVLVIGGVGGLVLAYGDVPATSGFDVHAITAMRHDFVAALVARYACCAAEPQGVAAR